jgi:chaperonin cofactor prefoldin
MPVKQHSHKHPEVEQRVKTLEAKTKKLEKAVRDLQHKLKTHGHPHTH